MAASSNVFAENALQLHGYGLCVVPMGADRKPQVRGFQKWLRRPSEGSVRAWVAKYGNCNIAIVPGLSNVIVADSDDALEDDQVEKLLGRTSLCVLTRRGRHRYYQCPNTDLPRDLRRFGLNVDLKAGNSIVIVPPSVHESGILYRHDNCDWGALADLPQLNLGNLQELMKGSPGALNDQRHLLKGRMRANSRGLWLNDRLCAMPASSYAQLLDHAGQLNNELSVAGFDPLEEAELGRRAAQVWKAIQDNRLQNPAQWSGAVKTSVPEMERLNQLDPKRASDALLLLLTLRAKHSARCQRGETFSITPKAMADSDVIGGWTRERYQCARDLLLQAGLLVQIRGFQAGGGGRTAAQYTLLDWHFEKATSTRGGGR